MVILKFKVKKSQEYIHFSLCFRYVSNWLRDRIESTTSSNFEMTEAWTEYSIYVTMSYFSLKNIYFVLRRISSVKLWMLSFGYDNNFKTPQIFYDNSNLKVSARVLTQKRTTEKSLTFKPLMRKANIIFVFSLFAIFHFLRQKFDRYVRIEYKF